MSVVPDALVAAEAFESPSVKRKRPQPVAGDVAEDQLVAKFRLAFDT